MNIEKNYRALIDDIENECIRCGRKAKEVKLVAVTKGRSEKEILELEKCGTKIFGESKAQQLLAKQENLPALCWHFIGALQSNKVRKVVGKVELIHSVDSISLAEKISKVSNENNLITQILLQVNISLEPTKQGLTRESWLNVFDKLLLLPNISLLGLMTMAPENAQVNEIASIFSSLRNFKEVLIKESGQSCLFAELSMGMSQDYKIAIAEGATLLRIGSALFKP